MTHHYVDKRNYDSIIVPNIDPRVEKRLKELEARVREIEICLDLQAEEDARIAKEFEHIVDVSDYPGFR